MALFCTAFATVFGLCSCEKEKNGDDPGTEPPVKLEDQIQYDGGALVDKAGNLVGINTAIVSQTGSYTGYSFAIPSNIVKKIAYDLIDYGSVKRAVLGVTMRPGWMQLQRMLSLPYW